MFVQVALIVFLYCNGWLLAEGAAAGICCVHPSGCCYLFSSGRRGSLGLLLCPLLFLSANEESISTVAMETVVFVVTVIGAAGRPAKIRLFLS